MSALDIPPSAEGVNPLDALESEVQRQVLQAKARILAAERIAAERFDPGVFSALGGSLDEMLARPAVGERYLIERLLGARHNMVLAAQYKTGKTTMGVNLIKSLADGVPFLGREVVPWEGRLAWWNGEMDDQDFNDYIRPLKVRSPKRVELLHLRGKPVSILDPHSADMVVKHLREKDIKVWCVDSWRRFCAWNGVNENENEAVERLTTRVDEIKERSGVQVFAAIAHTPRAAMEEGEERARGAAALDDWVDARWVLTKNRDGDRFLTVTGRGVDLEETKLIFNAGNNRLALGEGNRRTSISETLKLQLSLALKGAGPEGLTTSALTEQMGLGKKTATVSRVLEEMEKDGSVRSAPAKPRGTKWSWNG